MSKSLTRIFSFFKLNWTRNLHQQYVHEQRDRDPCIIRWHVFNSGFVNFNMKKVRYHDRVKKIIDEIMKILCSMHATKYHVSERENTMNFHLVCYYLFINNHAKKAFIICLYHTRMPTFYAAATHPMSSKSMAIFSLFIPLILAATNEFFTFYTDI